MNLGKIYLLVFVMCIGCTDNHKNPAIEVRIPTGQWAKGQVIRDSIFDGRVEYFDSAKKTYLGYTSFNCGYELGSSVRVEKSVTTDSVDYRQPLRNGYQYAFDSSGRLVYGAHFVDDRKFGPAYLYDNGELKHFYFYSFEGDIIYQSKFDSAGGYEKGSVINIKVNDRLDNGKQETVLFLYLIDQPNIDDYYELAVMDSNRQIVSSRRIKSDKCYYEAFLGTVLPDQHHAVIYHYAQKKDANIVIQEIFP